MTHKSHTPYQSYSRGPVVPMDEYENKAQPAGRGQRSVGASVRELLPWGGYRVDEAADGAEALPLAVAEPDVIVTDLDMPVMDGAAFFTSLLIWKGSSRGGAAERVAAGQDMATMLALICAGQQSWWRMTVSRHRNVLTLGT